MQAKHTDEESGQEHFRPSLFDTFDRSLSAEQQLPRSPDWVQRLWLRCGRYQGVVLVLLVILLGLYIFWTTRFSASPHA